MASIRDVYEITSKAATGGIDRATAAVKRHGEAIEKAAKQAAGASSRFGRLRGFISGLTDSFKELIGQGLEKATAAWDWFNESLNLGETRLGSFGKKVKELGGKTLKTVRKGFEALTKSALKTFSAVGKVGAGFVQKTAGIAKGALSSVGKAAMGLGLAVGALAMAAPVIAGLGNAIASASPKFAEAGSKLGEAWDTVKEKVLGAIGDALAPWLIKLAEAMEDPRFQEFIDKLAVFLADAITNVATFISEDLIPAIVLIWEESEPVREWIVDKFGTAFEWLMDDVMQPLWDMLVEAWPDIRETIEDAVGAVQKFVEDNWGSIETIIDGAMKFIRSVIRVILAVIKGNWDDAWEGIKGIVQGALDVITGIMDILKGVLEGPWNALKEIVKLIVNEVLQIVGRLVNTVIHFMNGLINIFNDTLSRLPGVDKLPPLPPWEPPQFAQGAIVKQPILGIVGDNPTSPEVVAPLHDLVSILRQALGGGGMGMQVNVNVAVAPGGFSTPEEAGQRAGDSFIRELRARGIRV